MFKVRRLPHCIMVNLVCLGCLNRLTMHGTTNIKFGELKFSDIFKNSILLYDNKRREQI